MFAHQRPDASCRRISPDPTAQHGFNGWAAPVALTLTRACRPCVLAKANALASWLEVQLLLREEPSKPGEGNVRERCEAEDWVLSSALDCVQSFAFPLRMSAGAGTGQSCFPSS